MQAHELIVSTGRRCVLTAGDHHLAEDLTQATYAKVYVRAGRGSRSAEQPAGIHPHGADCVPFLSHRTPAPVGRAARGARFRTLTPAHDPDHAPPGSTSLAAMRRLPPRDRTVLVLRYWEDLSVASHRRASRHPREHLPDTAPPGPWPGCAPSCPTCTHPVRPRRGPAMIDLPSVACTTACDDQHTDSAAIAGARPGAGHPLAASPPDSRGTGRRGRRPCWRSSASARGPSAGWPEAPSPGRRRRPRSPEAVATISTASTLAGLEALDGRSRTRRSGRQVVTDGLPSRG